MISNHQRIACYYKQKILSSSRSDKYSLKSTFAISESKTNCRRIGSQSGSTNGHPKGNAFCLGSADAVNSSLGAAFWALLGSGAVGRFEDLHPMVEVTRIYHLIQDDVHTYNHLFEIYMDLYFKLSDLFGLIFNL